MRRLAFGVAAIVIALAFVPAQAEDWPEFRGLGRAGVWHETGILEQFPAGGLTVRWRTPVRAGYSSPVVSDGRVFLTDFTRTSGYRGPERALALDERTGEVLWAYEWPSDYGGFMWPNGPRATPTVDGNRVYVLGARGVLLCLDVQDGSLLWQRDYVDDYGASVSSTGAGNAPVVEGDLVIGIVGGEGDAYVVAWDKRSGAERWRALSFNGEPGVSQPIVISAGGARQLIIWAPDGLHSLEPATGRTYWSQPFKTSASMNIPVPVFADQKLLISNFYTGSMLMALEEATPTATELWRGASESEIATDTLHSVIGTPIILDGHIYGVCSYGQLRCLRSSTGERVWETQALTTERARWASAHIVRNGDRQFIYNDRGELIIARLTPAGYEESDRTSVLTPTTPPGVRRKLSGVNVVHPAFANRHIYVRNDEEIISASLAATNRTTSGRPAPVVRGESARSAAASTLIDLRYIPSLSSDRKKIDPDAEYSTLYLLMGGGAHSLVFASEQGVVLVNTKGPGWGQAILDTLPLITEEPVTTIVNTHPGLEYTGSNAAFSSSIPVVSHANTRTAMARMPEFSGANAPRLPNRTFTDTMTLGEGDNRVDLHHFGVAHTSGDVVAMIPASNLAYLGELFPGKEVPRIDRSNGGSLAAFPDTLTRALERLRADNVQFIVPGRAEPSVQVGSQINVLSLADFEEYVAFTRAFVAAGRSSLAAGKTVDEAVADLSLPGVYATYDLAPARAAIQALADELTP
jgi:outer membrane protein assembly factor BamB/glyoxylase-like metal-dependent hydrolase (beta-lactamase superfamily II)